MLYSSITKQRKEYFSLGEDLYKNLLGYINPDLYLKTYNKSRDKDDINQSGGNFEFKRISAEGRATGKMPEHSLAAQAVRLLAKMKKEKDNAGRI